MRVTDDMVLRYLRWGRNYGEIESFKRIATSGRKWLIKLPTGTTTTATGREIGIYHPDALVPDEFVLTSREALVFGYGLAVAGDRPTTRREFAAREWDWDA